IVIFAHPVADAAGRVMGVLSTAVSPKYFDELLQDFDLPAGSSVSIADRQGRLLARAPGGRTWRGASLEGLIGQLGTNAGANAGLGPARMVRGLDGVERLYIGREVPDTGWRVLAGIPAELLFSRHREWLLTALALTLALFAVSAVLVYGIAARVRGQFRRALSGQQELMARLLRVEEQERGRISRELHDQIGQELTALALDLKSLRKRAEPAVLERAIAQSERLIDEVSDVTLALRPPQLDDLGLAAALKAHLEQHVRPHGIKVRLEADIEPGRLSKPLEVACFRIAQEALTNVLRHAQAGQAWVTLREERAELVLEVADDGRGFDVQAALRSGSDARSLGLRNLFDRAELVGGRLQIRPREGGGTQIEARFPL
ncbi:MAG TPA: ATP-binding protein, partial [Burkholderiales bacterium]|nr:ATP-binding protein [Burkholderiales bacterium]